MYFHAPIKATRGVGVTSGWMSGRCVTTFLLSSVDKSWWKDRNLSCLPLVFSSVLWNSCPPVFAASRPQDIEEDITLTVSQLRFWALFPDLAQSRVLLVQRPLKLSAVGLLILVIFSFCICHLRTYFYTACQCVHGKRGGYIAKIKQEKLQGF